MDIQALGEKFQLNQNEIAILTYIKEHRNDKNLSIRKVAKNNFSSPSSIVSMCQKMGFSGYSELLYYMVGATNLTFSLHQRSDVIKDYGDEFSGLMKKNKENHIMILSSGMSSHIADYMSDYLNLHHFRATTSSHLQLIRSNQKENTLIIAISNSGETKRLLELVKQAHANKLDVISFVGNSSSSLAKESTLAISSDTNSAYSYQDYYPQLFFGTSLNNFELLMSYTLSIWN